MKIIDFHAHIYPEKIALKATQAIGEFYHIPMRYHGQLEELLSNGRKIGVVRYIVHSTATKPEQVEAINNFIISTVAAHSEFTGYGTLHPAFANVESEIDRMLASGLKGVKLHPDFQKFQIDTPDMDTAYEILASRNMPILVHAGDYRYDYSGPRRIAHVLDKHPSLKVIAAHFGGYTEWSESFDLLCGRNENLWFDTSSSLWKLSPSEARRMMAKHGMHRFLFGSDFPMWDHEEELARFMKLELSPADCDAVLYGNAAALLGIE